MCHQCLIGQQTLPLPSVVKLESQGGDSWKETKKCGPVLTKAIIIPKQNWCPVLSPLKEGWLVAHMNSIYCSSLKEVSSFIILWPCH